MKDEQFGLGWIAAMFVAGVITGIIIGAGHERKKAVESGAAHYEVNRQTGETKFVYIKP